MYVSMHVYITIPRKFLKYEREKHWVREIPLN
jgi:hypothetical protein